MHVHVDVPVSCAMYSVDALLLVDEPFLSPTCALSLIHFLRPISCLFDAVAPVPVSSRLGAVTRAESSLTMAVKKGAKKVSLSICNNLFYVYDFVGLF